MNMYSPLDFQKQAAERAVQELLTSNRASVVMCCGSGKTFTGALIAEKLQANTVVVVAPTLLLVNQIAEEYRKTTSRVMYEYHSESEDIDIILNKNLSNSAIVTTYNSVPDLLSRMTTNGKNIDVMIYDEAHRTAGKFSGLFNQTLNGYPIVKKRVFMTATPRHASLNEKDDHAEFFSMDNRDIYGKIVYSYQIREAIDDGVTSDYKILVACVTDEDVRHYLKGKTISTSHHKAYALALTLRRAMEQYGLKKIITYHATIDEARIAAGIFSEVLDVPVAHVSSQQGQYTREANYSRYKNSDSGVITNARSLQEGMNVPATDAVMFCSIKTSEIDIIQCAGRAMRKYPGKDMGYIILPVLSGENALEHSDYSVIMSVLNSLSENDELLHQAIKLHMPDSKLGEHSLLPKFLRFTDDRTFDVKQLEQFIYLKIYESFNQSFFDRVEQFREFVRVNGHGRVQVAVSGSFGLWVKHIRKLNATKRLSAEKKRILDELGFIWDVYQDIFWESFYKLEIWLKEDGHTIEQASTGPFYAFLKSRRAAYRKGVLPPYQKDALDSLGVYFDRLAYDFERNLNLLKQEVDGDGRIAKSSELVSWVKYLRKKFKNNELSSKEIDQLEKAGLFLSPASQREDVFLEKLSLLTSFLREKKALTPILRSFRGTLRKRYRSGRLEGDRLQKIRELESQYSIHILDS